MVMPFWNDLVVKADFTAKAFSPHEVPSSRPSPPMPASPSRKGRRPIPGSSAMMAEAVHSSADCANQLLLFWDSNRPKEPTAQHPLGFGKATYFWSFVVALMLFSPRAELFRCRRRHPQAFPIPNRSRTLDRHHRPRRRDRPGSLVAQRLRRRNPGKGRRHALWRYFRKSREAS